MDIKEKKDEELLNYPLGGNDYANTAQIEMMRRLKNEIRSLNKTTSFYSRVLIFLTLIMTIAVIVQIYLLLSP